MAFEKHTKNMDHDVPVTLFANLVRLTSSLRPDPQTFHDADLVRFFYQHAFPQHAVPNDIIQHINIDLNEACRFFWAIAQPTIIGHALESISRCLQISTDLVRPRNQRTSCIIALLHTEPSLPPWVPRYVETRLEDGVILEACVVYTRDMSAFGIWSLLASSNIIADTEIILLQAVKNEYSALEYASPRLRDNDTIVLEAIKKNGCALQYASQRLRDDDALVNAAVKQRGFPLRFASERLRDNYSIVIEAVKLSVWSLECASERLRDNTIVVLEAVKKNGLALGFASARLRDNNTVVLEAVQNNGSAFSYASERLRDDDKVVLAAVKRDGMSLCMASQRLRDNDAIATEAVKRDGMSLCMVSQRLRDNDAIATEAVKNNEMALPYVSERWLQDNPEWHAKLTTMERKAYEAQQHIMMYRINRN